MGPVQVQTRVRQVQDRPLDSLDKILARKLKKANGHLKNNDCRLSTCTALNDEEDDDEDEEANEDEEAEDQDDDDKDE